VFAGTTLALKDLATFCGADCEFAVTARIAQGKAAANATRQ
jgi:hypothetical protein